SGDALCLFFFFSSRRRHTRFSRDWSSDVCSSDLSGSLQSCSTCRSRDCTACVLSTCCIHHTAPSYAGCSCCSTLGSARRRTHPYRFAKWHAVPRARQGSSDGGNVSRLKNAWRLRQKPPPRQRTRKRERHLSVTRDADARERGLHRASQCPNSALMHRFVCARIR